MTAGLTSFGLVSIPTRLRDCDLTRILSFAEDGWELHITHFVRLSEAGRIGAESAVLEPFGGVAVTRPYLLLVHAMQSRRVAGIASFAAAEPRLPVIVRALGRALILQSLASRPGSPIISDGKLSVELSAEELELAGALVDRMTKSLEEAVRDLERSSDLEGLLREAPAPSYGALIDINERLRSRMLE